MRTPSCRFHATHNGTFKQNKQRQQQRRQKSQTGAQFKPRLFCLSQRGEQVCSWPSACCCCCCCCCRRELQFFTYSTDTSLSSAVQAALGCLMKVTSDNGAGNIFVAPIKLHGYRQRYRVCDRYIEPRTQLWIDLLSLVTALACRDYANVRANAMAKPTERNLPLKVILQSKEDLTDCTVG